MVIFLRSYATNKIYMYMLFSDAKKIINKDENIHKQQSLL